MPLKYFAGMPLAVTIVGSIHGALFIALVVMLLVAVRRVPKLAAAIVPGGPFLLDRRLARLQSGR